MNGSQIKRILYTDAATKQCFIGVFPSDRIPHYNNTYPAACVINTDSDGGPGEHWIALYITSPEEVEFFDSFGRSPYEAPFSPNISNYIRQFKSVVRNYAQIQSSYSFVCGWYCVYFLLKRCRQLRFYSILSPFAKCFQQNDPLVKQFVDQYFNQAYLWNSGGVSVFGKTALYCHRTSLSTFTTKQWNPTSLPSVMTKQWNNHHKEGIKPTPQQLMKLAIIKIHFVL